MTDRDVLDLVHRELGMIAGMSSMPLTEAGRKDLRERAYDLLQEVSMYLGKEP